MRPSVLCVVFVALSTVVLCGCRGGWLSYRSTSASDHLFHGVKVNTATEQRQDHYWKVAFRQMSRRVPAGPAPAEGAPEAQTPQARTVSQRQRVNPEGARETGPDGTITAPEPQPITQGDPSLKEVALTFDDGPHLSTVHALLQELRDLDLHVTFFEVGKMVEKHPELVADEARDGHEIANHTFSHVNLSRISEREAATEYRACDLILHSITGEKPQYCRPPGGKFSPAVFRAAADNRLTTVLWTDDPRDYSNPGEQFILDRTLEHLKPGGIILLHEGVRQTMDVLPQLVDAIHQRGYRIVTVGELVRDSREARRVARTQS